MTLISVDCPPAPPLVMNNNTPIAEIASAILIVVSVDISLWLASKRQVGGCGFAASHQLAKPTRVERMTLEMTPISFNVFPFQRWPFRDQIVTCRCIEFANI